MFSKTLCDHYVRNALGVIATLGYIMPASMFIQKAARSGEILLPLVSLLAIALICLSLLHGFVGSYIHPNISIESDTSPQSSPRPSP